MDILIGDKIKELRKSRGITQEQLAEAIGISFQAVSKWENHIALPDITLVPALANYCKCQRKSEPGAHEKVSHKRPRKSEPERSRIVDPVC